MLHLINSVRNRFRLQGIISLPAKTGLAFIAFTVMGLTAQAQLVQPELSHADKAQSLNDASRIGRTAGSKAPEFQELYDYETSDQNLMSVSFPYQTILHKAYVVMLAEQHILSHPEAVTILKGLATVDSLAVNNPMLRVYLPYEAALIKQVGNVGGKMHIGRSRNDIDNTVNRMYLRDKLLDVIQSVIRLRLALIKKAQEHENTVMVVYTHRKEAQPVTLAHYLTALDESLAGSLDRYMELYQRLDKCPLGSGAAGGTSWPLNRERVAALLGFEGLVTNSIEGTAGWDHITEFASDNAIFMSTVGRLASEIQLWSTDEYNSAELDNAFAGISSMMPQKKNPDALERTRKASALVTGQLMGILASVNGIEYQHSGVRLMLEPKSIDAVLAGTHAMTGVVSTLHINEAVMLKYAREKFATMTDLADLLVQKAGMDFRDAHELIAEVVNMAISENKTADQITLSMIQSIALKKQGKALAINEQQLKDVLDPAQSVKRKTGIGMPAPSSVQKMIDKALSDIADKNKWLHNHQIQLQQTNNTLTDMLKKYS